MCAHVSYVYACVCVCAGESVSPSCRRTAPEAGGPRASVPLGLEAHGIVGGGRKARPTRGHVRGSA